MFYSPIISENLFSITEKLIESDVFFAKIGEPTKQDSTGGAGIWLYSN